MKRLVWGVLLLSLAGGSALAQTRVATVNLQKIFDKYWRTEQATTALKERVTELEKTHKEMMDDWVKGKEQYRKLLEDANNQAVSSEERERRRKSVEEKLKSLKAAEEDIAQFEQRATVTIGEQKARMRKNLLDEIKSTIDGKARAGGYATVFDSGSQTYAADPSGAYYTPNVLYTSETNDLTDAVISQLNAAAPVESPKAAEKPAEPAVKK
jgi:Skp family chaperone for outer membrane proteins